MPVSLHRMRTAKLRVKPIIATRTRSEGNQKQSASFYLNSINIIEIK